MGPRVAVGDMTRWLSSGRHRRVVTCSQTEQMHRLCPSHHSPALLIMYTINSSANGFVETSDRKSQTVAARDEGRICVAWVRSVVEIEQVFRFWPTTTHCTAFKFASRAINKIDEEKRTPIPCAQIHAALLMEVSARSW